MHKLLKRLPLYLLSMLALVMICIMLPTEANAASESDLTFTLNSDGQSYSVTDCNSSARGALVIPATYNGKPVTGIGNDAFNGCTKLTNVTIPDNVTRIGNRAFKDCISLTSITIPDSVTRIGFESFKNCSLTSVHITDIAAWCGIKFGSEFISIDSNPLCSADTLYLNGTPITDLVIPDGVTSIGYYAFSGYSGLTSVTIPDSVTSIDQGAFYSCNNLISVTIPESVTSIGGNAFYGCDNLPYNVYSDGKYLGNATNPYCVLMDTVSEDITSISINDATVFISAFAFSDCTGLTSVTIPASVKTIGESAFESCTSLSSVYITDIAAWCKITFEGFHANPLCFASDLYVNGALVTVLEIPKGITRINDYAFCNYTNLTGVTIPAGVKTIGFSAFYGCTNLTDITVPDSLTSIKGQAFEGCCIRKLIVAPGAKEVTASMIPCKSTLKEVIIPDSVTYINKGALSGCSGLETITIPFVGYVHKSATDSYQYPFGYIFGTVSYTGSTATEQYYYDSSTTNPTSNTYYIPNNLKKVTVNHNNIPYGAFYGCAGITQVILSDDTTTIGDRAFYNCTTLRTVTIPDSVTTVGGEAFYGCTNLRYNNFGNCKYLGNDSNPYLVLVRTSSTSIVSCQIHPTTKFISTEAFYSCTGLTNVTIPDSVTTIGRLAFRSCTGLDKVTIGDGITSISAYAFSGCGNLTRVIMGNSVSNIAHGAFKDCPKLETVTYCGTQAQWDAISIAEENTALTADTLQLHEYQNGICALCQDKAVHTVVFEDWDGTVLSSQTHYWGETVIAPADPSRTADNAYTYAFAGWDKNVVDCVGDAVYTATYTPTYIDYTVVFEDEDGTVLSTKTYHWGDTIAVPASPTKAADDTFTYTFAGWDKEVVTCAGDATYTATYSPSYIEYTIAFIDRYGMVYSTQTYHWGDTVIPPADPTKAATNLYTYTFAGWDKEVVPCAGDATYTAIFTSAYIDYTVVFKDWDGTVLSSNTYHWGDWVTVPENPVRNEDNIYYYSFAGWDKDVIKCAGDAVYTATYTSSSKGYIVTFQYWDGTILSSDCYLWGDEIVVPEAPIRAADNTYTYAFAGWDKEVVNCAGDTTYTATYTSTYIDYTVVFKDWDGTVLSSNTYHWGDWVTVPDNPVRKEDNIYYYSFAGWNKDVIKCAGDAVYTATYTSSSKGYIVTFQYWDGTILSSDCYLWGDEIVVPEAPIRSADNTYTYTFAGWDKEVVPCAGDTTYTATYISTYIDYTVVFKNWDGTILSSNTYHWGDEVTAPGNPTMAADNFYSYIFAGWNKDVVNCAGDAVYFATYTPTYIDYTVIFEDWDGTVLSSHVYHWGDAVAAPADPVRAADNVYTYTFAGWENWGVVCTGDATYTATYTSTYVDYIVIFEDWDSTVYFSYIYHWGDEVELPPEPVRGADYTYTYAFAGWDKEVVNCAGNVTYSATYSSTYIDYTVEFHNWDGTILSSNTYHWGDEITVPANPTRPDDDTYTYTFTAWDNPVVPCNGNAIYRAVYSSKSRIPSTITSPTYTISSGTISNISTGTTVSALLGKINEPEYVKVYNGNQELTRNTLVGTGTVVKIMDGNTVKASYTIVVTGDTNGDGKITVTDMLAVKAHVLKKSTLVGAPAQAADTSGDNAISITDFIQLKAHILGKSNVEARSEEPVQQRSAVSNGTTQMTSTSGNAPIVTTNYPVTYSSISEAQTVIGLNQTVALVPSKKSFVIV